MKYFYLYIFLLISFIVAVSYLNTYLNTYRESFDSNKQTFILLGDSILKNDAYVSDGKSVDDLLNEKTNGKSMCLATDHSKIIDVYSQVQKIPSELNSHFTTVFLSAGGNDILTHYVDQENDATDTSVLDPMFTSYKKLVQSVKTKLPNANVVLLDIYYPDNLKYKQYHPIINEWNNKIYDYARETKNNIRSVFKISNILTQQNDFSFGIEPSSNGSNKIVETIMSTY
jgi:lysophospholipase L1-like esterase